VSPPGRPKGEHRSAQREGIPLSPPGRPKGEHRSAQREGRPLSISPNAGWLITGCSSGLGRALARHVLEAGFRCAVTARDPGQVEDLVAVAPGRAFALALDVTDDAQRRHAVAEAERRLGGIDVLVNNAGYGYYAGIEEGEDAEIRAMFETNVFALAAMVRCVLPGMRARGRGHIVNVSSVAGLVAMPSAGYYAATKFAVEALTESLWKEVEPLGLRATLVEPGPFRTDFAARSMREPRHAIAAYAATAIARRAELQRNSGRQPGDPARAAQIVVDLLRSDEPPRRILLGRIGVARVREKLAALLASIDAHAALSASADFPPGAGNA
jgi:NAD(P)-dependent dehydrogenase (short-subunit alcohol dehydrogenase family)